MRVAVVGCGHWGKNLVRNFSELGALVAVNDMNTELAQEFASEYGVDALCFEDVLTSECDGVVIAAPAPLHRDLAVLAFEAGKHVYVEKPLAMTITEADEIIRASEISQRHLMVGHLLQYHPVFVALRDKLLAGDFGTLQYMYSNRLSLGKIRSEEDVVWSFAPHDISMLLSLANAPVASVQCIGNSQLQEGLADMAMLHMEFADGLKAHVQCSWYHPYKEQKLVVVGEKAMAVFDDTQEWSKKLAIYGHTMDKMQSPPLPEKAEVEYVSVPKGEPLKSECAYFLDLMAGRVPSRTDGYEARAVLNVLTAASSSMQRGELIHA